MHWVQTSLVALAPLGRVTRRRCRFGLNFRRVIPVIFVPTPPRYFCLPRMVTEFPIENPFPQTSQQRAITPPFSYKNMPETKPHDTGDTETRKMSEAGWLYFSFGTRFPAICRGLLRGLAVEEEHRERTRWSRARLRRRWFECPASR